VGLFGFVLQFARGAAPGSCADSANIGNVLDFNYNFSLGAADNGNVTSFTNNRDAARSQSFTYDSLNRIATADTQATPSTNATKCWGESFSYDAWGNLLSIGGLSGYTGCSQESLTVSATTKNQLNGYGYDAAGNMTSIPSIASYTYNAESQLTSAAGVTYTYDVLGRVATVSNPHRSAAGPTDGITTIQYDALGRVTKVILPDGSASSNNISTAYSDNCATVTDQAGKIRKSCWDSLWRLTQAFEPNSSNALVNETDYQYDALGNLTRVDQKGNTADSTQWRTRTFVYDALSRLTSETTPEAGTITYGYDNSSNLTSRIAPAPNQTGSATVTTTYSYDQLNRLKTKFYSDGTTPQANFSYDVATSWPGTWSNLVGRLSAFWTSLPVPGTATVFSYDSMGRVIRNDQCTPYNCNGSFPSNLSYDLAGDMTSYTNGVGVTFTQSFDTAGRVAGLTSTFVDSQHPATLATVDSSVGYFPAGAIRKITLGNGLTETAAYNNRLQPCRMNVNSSSSYLTNCSDAAPSGNVEDFNYGFNSGTANNGNIAFMTATGTQAFNRSYTYDSLNRLSTMADSNTSQTCRGLSWNYDAWGNRSDQNVTAGACGQSHVGVLSNNRLLSPYTYDAAGNMTYDGTTTYTYDAENRIISAVNSTSGTTTYVYDATGRRVEKSTSTGKIEYIYDLGSKVVTEYYVGMGGYTGWGNGYVYLNGNLLAQYANSTTYFVHKDHLGSTRLVTGVNQAISDNLDFLPFGEQYSGSSVTTHKFTGDERDSETSLDHTLFRKYSSQLGRWTSPDPLGGSVDNPQSLNRYSYVLDNPLNYVDPLGLDFYQPWGPNCIAHFTSTQYTTQDKDGNVTIHTTILLDSVVCVGGLGGGVGGPFLQPFPPPFVRPDIGGCSVFLPCKKPSKPSCPAVFFNSAIHAFDNLPVFPPGQGPEDVARAAAGAAATKYIIDRGLAVPLRSSIVRGILGAGEWLADLTIFVPLDFAAGEGVIDEYQAWKSGTCGTIWSNP
jgi:RHS repeat-associated protein